MRSIYVGYDPREIAAFEVAVASIKDHLTTPVPVHDICLAEMKAAGFYRRPTEVRDGRLWDVISEAPCATEFSISRFLTPLLAQWGWALFMDCDMLVRADLNDLFALCDDRYAVMCVKHRHEPAEQRKMDNQIQTRYSRKNWSSVMAVNVGHPANKALTVDLINTVPGRDLHRFCWLKDEDIGELGPEWNWLAGHSDPSIDAKIAHFTLGTPDMRGYEKQRYADEWWLTLDRHCTALRRA